MKKISFAIFFVFMAIVSFGQQKQTKKEWILSYKQAVYYQGLLKGFSDVEFTKKLVSIDRSFYNPVFQVLHEKAIKKGSVYLTNLIRKDSMDREGRVAEPADGKRVLLICLNFYSSQKLNEMANREYLNWMKVPNKQKLIDKANSMY